MSAIVLNGKEVAQAVRLEVAEGVREFVGHHGTPPGLAAVLVGNDPASAIYVRNKRRACDEVGMFSETFDLPDSTEEDELLDLIRDLNVDHRFHGILVQLPLPRQIDERKATVAVNPEKDVDGIHPMNLGRLLEGSPVYVPGTPAGILELLFRNGYDATGKHVVICGRSNIVGKPMANLFMQKRPGCNATVTICHTGTQNLASITLQADILVVATGNPGMVTGDMVKPGSVVIDVGVNRVPDETKQRGYRLVGDVDFDQVSKVAGAITPVPGGVGPMTIAMLLSNTLEAARRSKRDSE